LLSDYTIKTGAVHFSVLWMLLLHFNNNKMNFGCLQDSGVNVQASSI